MKYPTKKYLGKTWVGWLNFLLLQWAFIRLQGNIESTTDRELISWEIIFVVPLTGWWSNYFPSNPKQVTIYTFPKKEPV